MLDYDPTSYPSGELGWERLFAAIEAADKHAENWWLELKAVDLREKSQRPIVAKAIVAFANRDIETARNWLDGRALVVVGVEPGSVRGAPLMDPADVANALNPFLAEPRPSWDLAFHQYKGERVLVITVDPPKQGDPIFCIGQSGSGVNDGDVYVRQMGKSERATSADIRRLERRAVDERRSTLAIEVGATIDNGVTFYKPPSGWIDAWLLKERRRLLAPLERPKTSTRMTRETEKLLGPSLASHFASLDKVSRLAAQMNSILVEHHDETRTPEEFTTEVEKYLARCEKRLNRLAVDLAAANANTVTYWVQNNTKSNYSSLEVTIHAEGDVETFENPAAGRVQRYLPRPPRVWGPWETRKDTFDGISRSAILPRQPYTPSPPRIGPTIVNGGSSTITFLPIDLRPGQTVQLADDRLVLLGRGEATDSVRVTWKATATNVDDLAEDAFTLDTQPVLLDVPSLLDAHFESDAAAPRGGLILPDIFDDDE